MDQHEGKGVLNLKNEENNWYKWSKEVLNWKNEQNDLCALLLRYTFIRI